uniref:Putative secreted protein n=1 Tax=Anopheles darlingi TaxID=43151 RepID=A0A2M4DLI0_ANODA
MSDRRVSFARPVRGSGFFFISFFLYLLSLGSSSRAHSFIIKSVPPLERVPTRELNRVPFDPRFQLSNEAIVFHVLHRKRWEREGAIRRGP